MGVDGSALTVDSSPLYASSIVTLPPLITLPPLVILSEAKDLSRCTEVLHCTQYDKALPPTMQTVQNML